MKILKQLCKTFPASPAQQDSDFIKKLKEEVQEAAETNARQESHMQTLIAEKAHLHTEAGEYSKHIVEHARNTADLQGDKEKATRAMSEQKALYKRWWQQKKIQGRLRPTGCAKWLAEGNGCELQQDHNRGRSRRPEKSLESIARAHGGTWR